MENRIDLPGQDTTFEPASGFDNTGFTNTEFDHAEVSGNTVTEPAADADTSPEQPSTSASSDGWLSTALRELSEHPLVTPVRDFVTRRPVATAAIATLAVASLFVAQRRIRR